MGDERSDERATASVGGAADGRPGGSTATPGGTAAAPPGDDPVRVLVLVRADCRTCDRMEGVVREICGRVGEEHTVIDVDAPGADPEWRAEYGDRVPVTLVDDVEIASWRLEPADLVRALGGTAGEAGGETP